MGNIFKYITLGVEVFNAVTTLIALFKSPTTPTPAAVWEVVHPVILEVSDVAKITINPTLAQKIVQDALDTIASARGKVITPGA